MINNIQVTTHADMLKKRAPVKGLFALIILLGSFLPGTVLAQELTPSDDAVNAIAKQLYCPVCENVPLDVCGTQACEQWRELIRLRLAEGWSEEQIKQYFVVQYGDRVLATPPASGLNWLVYIVPPLALLTGLVIIFQALRSWKRAGTPQEQIKPLDLEKDEYVQLVEEELRKR